MENAIGRMRRTLPRKTDLAELPDDRRVGAQLQQHPAQMPGCYTPEKYCRTLTFHQPGVALEMESSFPLSRE